MMLSFAKTSLLLALAAVLSVEASVDVTFKSISCNANLPVFPEFYKHCKKNYCTFGQTANFAGKLTYSGLEVQQAYFSADLTIDTIGYSTSLLEDVKLPLCGDSYIVPLYDNGYECPDDGEYTFDFEYTLPELGWYSSGWSGSAELNIVDVNGNQLGYCQIGLVTSVTSSSATGGISSPSAKNTLGLILGSLALVILGCCCYCCTCRGRKKADDSYERHSRFTRMGYIA